MTVNGLLCLYGTLLDPSPSHYNLSAGPTLYSLSLSSLSISWLLASSLSLVILYLHIYPLSSPRTSRQYHQLDNSNTPIYFTLRMESCRQSGVCCGNVGEFRRRPKWQRRNKLEDVLKNLKACAGVSGFHN